MSLLHYSPRDRHLQTCTTSHTENQWPNEARSEHIYPKSLQKENVRAHALLTVGRSVIFVFQGQKF